MLPPFAKRGNIPKFILSKFPLPIPATAFLFRTYSPGSNIAGTRSPDPDPGTNAPFCKPLPDSLKPLLTPKPIKLVKLPTAYSSEARRIVFNISIATPLIASPKLSALSMEASKALTIPSLNVAGKFTPKL